MNERGNIKVMKPNMYKGEVICSDVYKSGVKKGKPCENKAYYFQDKKYCCGVHSIKKKRTELNVNPDNEKNKKQDAAKRERMVIECTKKNVKEGKVGTVMCSKYKQRIAAPHCDGYLSIFPNNKHENRSDGIGYSSLSPMIMGPVKVGDDRVPEATSLENFWQGSKCYTSECTNNRPDRDFYTGRNDTFTSKEPIRHKKVPPMSFSGERNCTEFFVWPKKDGKEVYFKYFDSRQFYCVLYERFASVNKDFLELKNSMIKGMNLNIIGYDGFDFSDVKGETLVEKMVYCYKDVRRPFGHELCLVAMLILKPEDYPWKKYITEDI